MDGMQRSLAVTTNRAPAVATTSRAPAVATTSVRPDAANYRGKDAAIAFSIGSAMANTRPKALEYAATLSMVATANSIDATKGEEQATSDVRR
jgi:hypothetical protein